MTAWYPAANAIAACAHDMPCFHSVHVVKMHNRRPALRSDLFASADLPVLRAERFSPDRPKITLVLTDGVGAAWHRRLLWEDLTEGDVALSAGRMVTETDVQLGRVFAAVHKAGAWDNTIVVLWTDHGFHIGEKENWEKFALWTQTTRVPLFIHVLEGEVTVDYGPRGNEFNGAIRGVQIAIAKAADSADHRVSPEEALRVAMARQ